MRCMIGLVLCLSAFSCSGPQMSMEIQQSYPDPGEIMAKADAAMKNVELVSYNARYEATGWVKAFVPQVKGKVIQGPKSKYDLDQFFAEVKLKAYDSEDTIQCTIGSNGDSFFLIDPKTYTAYEDIDPAVLGSQSRNFQRVLLREFSSDEPFKDELKADSIEIIGTQVIDGQRCYNVFVKIEDHSDTVWSISQKDYLPRFVKRIHKSPEGEEGTTELTITQLVVNPKFSYDPFRLQVPHGYKKTDDFAP